MLLAESSVGERPDNPLQQSWPGFLDLLDADPDAGFAGFYDFARRLLTTVPPRVMRQVHEINREDLIHDIILHCCQNDFAILRRYTDRGKPFGAWLSLVARNKILDWLRAPRNARADAALAEEDDDNPGVVLPDAAPLADEQLDRQRIIGLVQGVLAGLESKCRILVQGAAEGYKPRELTRLMGWPADWNKKASDDLRDCRRRLKDLLSAEGLGPQALQEHFGG